MEEAPLSRIVLRLRGTKYIFKVGQIKKKSYMIPLYLQIIVFLPKIGPLTATGMTLCVDLDPKMSYLFPLVSD
jgi:hypothetical protein